MKGYFNNPQATAETITADGWLRTGDIVRADEDGYIWILDRKRVDQIQGIPGASG